VVERLPIKEERGWRSNKVGVVRKARRVWDFNAVGDCCGGERLKCARASRFFACNQRADSDISR
jgi:hypothetical protein